MDDTSEYEKKISDLECKIEDCESDNVSLAFSVEEMEGKYIMLDNEMTEKDSKIYELESENNQLELENDQLESENRELEHDIEIRNKEIKLLKQIKSNFEDLLQRINTYQEPILEHNCEFNTFPWMKLDK